MKFINGCIYFIIWRKIKPSYYIYFAIFLMFSNWNFWKLSSIFLKNELCTITTFNRVWKLPRSINEWGLWVKNALILSILFLMHWYNFYFLSSEVLSFHFYTTLINFFFIGFFYNEYWICDGKVLLFFRSLGRTPGNVSKKIFFFANDMTLL